MTESAAARRWRGQAWREVIIVRNPAFGLLWTGQLLSGTGNWLLVVAVPVYVLRLTGSARDAGLAFVAEVLPVLLIGPVAGVFADRWRHRATMITADVLRAGCVAAMILVSHRGQVPVLLALLFGENLFGAFFDPAHSALLPAITGRGPDLSSANGWYSVSRGIVRLAGAPAGGALYLLAGFRLVAAIDAVSYLVSAAFVAAMPRDSADRIGRPERPGRRFTGELRHGVAALFADRVLRVLLGVSALFLLGNGALTALLVPYVVSRLHDGAAVVGVLFSVLGACYLGSAYLGRKVADSPRLRRAVTALLAAATAAFAGFFGWHQVAGCLVFIALIGLTGGAFLMVRSVLVERRADAGAVGRVSSVCSTAEMAATLAGAGLASALVTPLGLTTALNCSIAVVAAAALLAVRLPGAASPGAAAAGRPGPPSPAAGPRLAEPGGQGAVSARRSAVQPGREP
jgi:predicted MFS family arabinose efflux permease